MTNRAFLLFPVMLTAFLSGFSTGRSIFYLIGICFLLCYLTGALTAFFLKITLKVSCEMPQKQVLRGENIRLRVHARHACFLPVLPLSITFSYGSQEMKSNLSLPSFEEREMNITLPALHVGNFPFEMKKAEIRDGFGLFKVKIKDLGKGDILVLPRPFEVEKPTVSAGDQGVSRLGRTQEDYAAPEDVRTYIPGDAMKRIHWKLSAEKRELLVRRYEMPSPPDTLILVDGSLPEGQNQEEILLNRDALCETAAAVAALQLEDHSPVRVPFYGEKANEFSSDGKENLKSLQEMLALQPFSGKEPFERALQLEIRRMRRTGAVILLTTRLTPQVVESAANIRRLGPHVRLYLVTKEEESEELLPMINRLQHHLVEVLYVTPA